MKTRKRRVRKLLSWSTTQHTVSHGNRFWNSSDGRYRIVCSELYDGIPLPKLYNVWEEYYSQATGGLDFRKVAEFGSRARAVKECELRATLYEESCKIGDE